MEPRSMTTQALLAGAVALGGALAGLLGWWLVPAALSLPVAHGHRAEMRRLALAGSALARIAIPAIRVLAHHARRLALPALRQRLAARLVQAGEPAGLCVDEFLGLTGLCAIGGAAVGLFAAGQLGGAVVVLLAALGAYYPTLWLQEAASRRLRLIDKGLPYANDLLVLAMRAGVDLVGALRHYAGKAKDRREPVAQELGRVLRDVEFGATRRAALEALAERAPTDSVKGFVAAVVQAEQRGTPIADALAMQATVMRTHRSLLVERLANRAGVLILLPLLLLFCATILTLFGGIIVKAVRGELM